MTAVNLREMIETLVEQELAEMPIASYKTIGDFSKGSSIANPVDRRLLTNPKAIEKITRQWEKTPFQFDLFVINDKRVRQFREIGSVDYNQFVLGTLKMTPEEVPQPLPGRITVLFTNNSGDERYMASGWILAHRFGHALARSRDDSGKEWEFFTRRLQGLVLDILRDVYDIELGNERTMLGGKSEKILMYVAQQLGTMKSARDKNLRNWFEFAYELLAQYMLTGSVKLNPLPDRIVTGMGGWGREQTKGVMYQGSQKMYNNHDLEYYSGELESMLDNVLSRAVGKTYVM